MFFNKLIKQAQKRSSRLENRLDRLRKTLRGFERREQRWHDHFKRNRSQLEALKADEIVDGLEWPRVWRWPGGSWHIDWVQKPAQRADVRQWVDQWQNLFELLATIQRRLKARIRRLEEAKFEIDYWLLDKRERWAHADERVIEDQVRQIRDACRQLSQLILGRPVRLSFDKAERAPLGYVSLSRTKGKAKTIFLSAALFAEQPQGVVDLYRALIVHELGHYLLHYRPGNAGFRKIKKAIQRSIKVNQHYQQIVNILMDEQLERWLRDRRKQWRVWFNKLEFHTRKIDPYDLKTSLYRAGLHQVDKAYQIDLSPYETQGLIKTYREPTSGREQFVTILSGWMLNRQFGMNPLFSFYYALRHPIEREKVDDEPVATALQLVPVDLKDLSLLDLHRLARQIFSVLFPKELCQYTRVRIRHVGGSEEVFIVPGERLDKTNKSLLVELTSNKVKAGKQEVWTEHQQRRVPPGADPEGGQEPPRTRTTSQTHRRPRGGSGGGRPHVPVSGVGRNYGDLRGGIGGSTLHRVARLLGRKGKGLGAGGGGRGSAATRLAQKMRSGHVSAKEKARLRKEIKQERNKAQQKPAKKPRRPKHHKRPKRKGAAQETPHGLNETRSEFLEFEDDSHGSDVDESIGSAGLDVYKELNQVLRQIEKQQPTKPRLAKRLRKVLPRCTPARDQKNTAATNTFPPLEATYTMVPDRAAERRAVLDVQRYVPLLRRYLYIRNEYPGLLERLPAGRFLPAGMLKKHVLTGELRLFEHPRQVETESYERFHVTLLIDTSASMHNDRRLERARLAATELSSCFTSCPGLQTSIVAFNESVYLCGDHLEPALFGLQPQGRTNEAAALDYLAREQHVDVARQRIVLTLSDGLPTACSVEAVRAQVELLQRHDRFRLIYCALSAEPHPAYQHKIALFPKFNATTIQHLGRGLRGVLR